MRLHARMDWRRGWRAALVAGLLGLPIFGVPAAAAGPVEDFEGSGVDRALDLQYELAGDLPLRNTPWVGTHNSFNSSAEMGTTLSTQDSNQQITILDQLEIDVRSLELDVHRFPSAEGGGFAPVICHARGGGEAHFGCSSEKTLAPVLEQIVTWLRLPANSDQVLLLYLEDHLDNADGYDQAAEVVSEKLGPLLYRPPASGCTELPYGLTRDGIAATGAQVIVVSDCGAGSGWPSVAFKWDEHKEERPFGYRDFPDCGPDFTRADLSVESDPLLRGHHPPDRDGRPARRRHHAADSGRDGALRRRPDRARPAAAQRRAPRGAGLELGRGPARPRALRVPGPRPRRVAGTLAHAGMLEAAPAGLPHRRWRLAARTSLRARDCRTPGLPKGRCGLRRAAHGFRGPASAPGDGERRRQAGLARVSPRRLQLGRARPALSGSTTAIGSERGPFGLSGRWSRAERPQVRRRSRAPRRELCPQSVPMGRPRDTERRRGDDAVSYLSSLLS